MASDKNKICDRVNDSFGGDTILCYFQIMRANKKLRKLIRLLKIGESARFVAIVVVLCCWSNVGVRFHSVLASQPSIGVYGCGAHTHIIDSGVSVIA